MIILIRLNISNALNEEQFIGRQSEIDADAAADDDDAAAADDDADDDYDDDSRGVLLLQIYR